MEDEGGANLNTPEAQATIERYSRELAKGQHGDNFIPLKKELVAPAGQRPWGSMASMLPYSALACILDGISVMVATH